MSDELYLYLSVNYPHILRVYETEEGVICFIPVAKLSPYGFEYEGQNYAMVFYNAKIDIFATLEDSCLSFEEMDSYYSRVDELRSQFDNEFCDYSERGRLHRVVRRKFCDEEGKQCFIVSDIDVHPRRRCAEYTTTMKIYPDSSELSKYIWTPVGEYRGVLGNLQWGKDIV